MSNINEITDSEKLFVELTPEEGACVSGGATFQLRNNLNNPMGIAIRGVDPILSTTTAWQVKTLPGGGEETISCDFPGYDLAEVAFDKRTGPPFELELKTINPDEPNIFSSVGTEVIMSNIGSFKLTG